MADLQNLLDRNLADSISMLEQILEVMPHDPDALKALYSAYLKAGEYSHAFSYLIRLVDLVLSRQERSIIPFIQDELELFSTRFPSEVESQVARLKGISSPEAAMAAPALENGEARPNIRKKRDVDISEELALAWRLYEESQLSQEEYSSVLHDLTEVSSKDLDVPASVLHVLNDRGFMQMNRIMNYLSSRSGAPCITLSNFEIPSGIVDRLPLEMAAYHGALPFAFLGKDLLVAVLNPFNHRLVDKIESESGCRCHTYLVDAEDYDRALDRLRSLYGAASSQNRP